MEFEKILQSADAAHISKRPVRQRLNFIVVERQQM